MKMVTSILLTIFLVINPFTTANAETSKIHLTDVANHWAKESIENWVRDGLILGYPDGTFRPNQPITKAEVITLINRIYGYHEYAAENYSDVLIHDWFSDETKLAKGNNYMSWYTDDMLYPKTDITREEICSIIASILNLEATKEQSAVAPFTDKDNISDWSLSYVDAVVDYGYMKGYPDNTLRATQTITRAETVIVLDRAIGRLIPESGTYGDENTEAINSNITITANDVILKNKIINGDLVLGAGIQEGEVELENVEVKGKTIINGGGENSITFTNCNLNSIIVLKVNGKIRVVSADSTIEKIQALSGSKFEGDFDITDIKVLAPGETITFDGNFSTIELATRAEIFVTDDTTIKKITVSKDAADTTIDVGSKAILDEVVFEGAANVTGVGTIKMALIKVNGVLVEQLVEEKSVDAGIDGSGVTEKVTDTGSSGGTSTPPPTPDTIPPTVANSGAITTSAIATTSLTLNWSKATDDTSDQSDLAYQVYYSESNNIDTIINIESNGTPFDSYTTDISTIVITGLSEGTTYYFNILVKDEADNISAYATVSATTGSEKATSITASDSDTLYGGIDGRDITINWTPSFNSSVTSQEIYLVTSGTAIDIDTMRAIVMINDNTTTTWTGNAGIIIDSEGTLLTSGNYDVYVVSSYGSTNIASDKGSYFITSEGIEDGTTDHPYLIDCIEDLAKIGHGIDGGTDWVNSGEWGLDKNYKLMTNLDFTLDSSYGNPTTQQGDFNGDATNSGIKVELTSEGGWLSIGNASTKFAGTFDGQNKTINNLYIFRITTTDGSLGLFGYGSNATIKNFNLTNVSITGNCNNGRNIGGVTGILENSSTITNCHISGSIRGGHNVGGVVGSINNSTATYLSSSGEVKEGLAQDGTENGNVNGSQRQFGGLIGYSYESDVYYSYSSSNVSGRYQDFGGLIGCFTGRSNNSIISCYATGNVSATKMPSYNTNNAGGLVGSFGSDYTANNIINCYSTGDVIGTGDNVGGLIGSAGTYRGSPIITNCYALGVVSGSARVGGLIGTCDGGGSHTITVSNNIAFNTSISGTSNVNRVLGYIDIGTNITKSNNYANENMTVTGGSPTDFTKVVDGVDGADMSAEQFKLGSENGNGTDYTKDNTEPYTNWEFDSDDDGDLAYWKIENDRPVLYVDPDGDDIFEKLGPDDGKLPIT